MSNHTELVFSITVGGPNKDTFTSRPGSLLPIIEFVVPESVRAFAASAGTCHTQEERFRYVLQYLPLIDKRPRPLYVFGGISSFEELGDALQNVEHLSKIAKLMSCNKAPHTAGFSSVTSPLS